MKIPPFVCPVQMRDYQVETITQAIIHLEKQINPCICLPTGTGKTKTCMELLRNLWIKDTSRRFLMIVPSDELRTDARQEALIFGLANQIDVQTYQTLYRRYKDYSGYYLIVNDECHGVASPTWTKTLEYFRSHGSLFLGLSATPERLDGKALDVFFDVLIQPYSVQWYEDHGYLAPVRLLSPELKSFLITGTNDDLDYQSSLLDKPEITGDAIEHWLEHAKDLKTLIFCSSVEHAANVAKQYNDRLAPIYGREIAVALDSQTPKSIRTEIFNNFRTATVDQGYLILVNVQLFTTGVDIPDAKCCQLLRKTQSRSLFNQMIGRVRRPTGVTAIGLDHVGNKLLHGHPNFTIKYDLKGAIKAEKEKKEKEETEAYPTLCPECSFAVSVTTDSWKCFNCGWELARKKDKVRGNKQPTQKQGKLVEYELHPAHNEVSKAIHKFKTGKTLEGNRYKKGWMVHRVKEMYKKYPEFPDDLGIFMLTNAGYTDTISRLLVGQIKANPDM